MDEENTQYETQSDEQSQEPTTQPPDPLRECELKRDEYLAGWQRAKADFSNYKREEAERVRRLIQLGAEELILDLLTVVDNFDLAIMTMEKQGQVDQGIYMIRSQFLDILKRQGLERLKTEIGQPFNPATSEAISEIESDLDEGMVVEEVGAGYTFQGKIIRPSRVKVSKGKSK